MVFVAQEPQSSCTQANIGHISSFKADGDFGPSAFLTILCLELNILLSF